jgi:hypothetical protein
MMMSRIVPVFLLAFAISPVWEVALAGSERSQTQPPQTQFDGYVWLDIHGEPLPFQSDAEIEDFLRTAEVIDSTIVSEGITMPRRVVLSRDGISAHAIFKDVDVERHKVTERTYGRSHFYLDWRDSHLYDNAAYVIDRMLGINRVPPAVNRRIGGSSGTMIIWIEGTMTESERRKTGLQPPDLVAWNRQMQIMHIFNNLIARRDVNPGNTLIDADWRVWFIDSTRAFGTVDDLLCAGSITSCERGLFESLQSLDPTKVRQELRSYLPKSEIDALLKRQKKIVAFLLDLIDQRGAEAVIFDMMVGDSTGE